MRNRTLFKNLLVGALLTFNSEARASSGTEGASFLDIPVGAGPAALGGAYSALASDAYAPVWNPGGLGFLESNQLTGQHLSYIGSIHYEFASYVQPLGKGRSLGASLQYLGSGDMAGADLAGNPTGDFSAHYAAYSLAFGQSFGEKLSLGITGKMINAKISDVGASAYAFDLGSMYKLTKKLTLAGVLANVGTKLTFIDQKDSLPLAFRAGARYAVSDRVDVSAEGVYRQTGLASLHTGVEWTPVSLVALRLGYRTDTLKGLSPLAGLTTGIGIKAGGYEFSYAWLPMGELGNTQYFSMSMKFGEPKNAKQNLIQHKKTEPGEPIEQLIELLDYNDKKAAVAKNVE